MPTFHEMFHLPRQEPEIVDTPHGQLAFRQSGPEDGSPVILMHGTPGSGLGIRPRQAALARANIRLISYDRPGYGGSTRRAGRRLVDETDNVASLHSHLELDRFGIVARSGGGPYAIACAAAGRFESTLRKVAILGGLVPKFFTDGPQSTAGSNMTVLESDLQGIREEISKRTKQVARNSHYLLDLLEPDLTSSDQQVLSNPVVKQLIRDTYEDAVRQGPDGWFDDLAALQAPPGFSLSDIHTPVLFWHGTDDPFADARQTETLASQIKNAPTEITIAPGKSHFSMLDVLMEYLIQVCID